MQNDFYMSNERNWSLLLLLRRRCPMRLCILFVLFLLFGSLNFVTTTLDKFQLQSQVRLPQIIIVIPIRLKFKLYAIFIELVSGINFLFVERQHNVNYCKNQSLQDFQKLSQKVGPGHCSTCLVRKVY